MSKRSILLVDDSELNRALLSDMPESDYDIIEAENGAEAIRILHEKVHLQKLEATGCV